MSEANKAKVAAKKDRKRERLRELVRAAKDRPCAHCSKLVNFGATARVVDELAKCEAVCANCHRVRTWRRRIGPDGERAT
jgi:hypothetical protein